MNKILYLLLFLVAAIILHQYMYGVEGFYALIFEQDSPSQLVRNTNLLNQFMKGAKVNINISTTYMENGGFVSAACPLVNIDNKTFSVKCPNNKIMRESYNNLHDIVKRIY